MRRIVDRFELVPLVCPNVRGIRKPVYQHEARRPIGWTWFDSSWVFFVQRKGQVLSLCFGFGDTVSSYSHQIQ